MLENYIKSGSEFLVNTFIGANQYDSQFVALSDGTYIATWASNYGIIIQKYDAHGIETGTEQIILPASAGGFGYATDFTALPNGQYALAWATNTDSGPNGYDASIRVLVYNGDGSPAGSPTIVADQTSLLRVFDAPSVAQLEGGGMVVTWKMPVPDKIVAQIYDESGTEVGGIISVSGPDNSDKSLGEVTGLMGGGFVVVWTSGGSARDVSAKVFDANGMATSAEFLAGFSGDYPPVTALTNGGFIISGIDSVQLFDAVGNTVGSSKDVAANQLELGNIHIREVAQMKDGGFVVTFSATEVNTADVYAQRFDANGHAIGQSFKVNTLDLDYQHEPSINVLDDGGYVISWTDEHGYDGSLSGIYAQQFAAQLFGTAQADVLIDDLGADWMHGRGGDDILKGKSGADYIEGGGGSDRLFGGGGTDMLLGGGGKDILKGGGGNDTLDGGSGKDVLKGGNGADVFVFNGGKDRIVDFTAADALQIEADFLDEAVPVAADLANYASVVGGNLLLDFGDGQILKFKGIIDVNDILGDVSFI